MNRPVVHELDSTQDAQDVLRRNQELIVVGQFAAMVMHEINGPLEAVHNLNYLIQQEADNPSKVRIFTGMLEEQLNTLTKLSRQTLSFYRSPETRESTPISTLAEAALRVYQRKISAKRITIRKRLKADVTAEVHAGDMLQVFSNLISNAIDALPENGTLAVSVRSAAHEAHVTVADNGPGIPAPILPKIFDPFFTTKQDLGNGLGLWITHDIVTRHAGSIQVRSKVHATSSGTIFTTFLPHHKESATATAL